ncbi:MAG: NAD+ synthase [Candidatus Omnitrophica bacterium]|nr:NAD+ synthase [Candidatus Omnitrophota bacterium]
MKVALLQLNMIVGDIQGNSAKIIRAVKQKSADKVDLCISSELALLGYPPRDLLFNQAFITQAQAALKDIAGQLIDYPALVLGTAEPVLKTTGKPLYNCASLIHKGKVEQSFHKTLLPTYDVFDEERYFEPAMMPGVFELAGVKIGVTICEDVWNDIDFATSRRYKIDPLQILAQKNVQCIINLSASPFSLGKQKLREKLLSNIAKKYQVNLVYVNQVGGNDDLVFDGRSCVFDKQGDLIAKAKAFAEDIMICDLSTDLAKLKTHECLPEAEAWKALVLGTHDYVEKCGFKKVVLGLSGGIDSALTAAIAVEALGADNVLGVLLPSPYSSKGSIDDSLKLADNLGIKTITLPIQEIMSAYDQALKSAFSGFKAGLAEENIQARIRGNILMGLSNKYGAMLLTTGNKSELSVGYCTIYGDMSGGFAVISDVPKTLVYQIAKYVNKIKATELIPQVIMEKAPSAELRPNQLDQDSLPEYEVLDAILFRCIEQHKSVQEIISDGFNPEQVKKVLKLVHKAEFKRKQAAPGIKITDRAFGIGWRMPIASMRSF